MSLDGIYDSANVFARILRGELPCAKVYEDANTFAFLDIAPQSTGHTLVVSKWSQGRNILDIEHEALCQIMGTVQRVARALRRVLNPDGLRVVQFNGADAGQTVFHLHVHIIPHWKSLQAQGGEPAALAARIAAACEE